MRKHLLIWTFVLSALQGACSSEVDVPTHTEQAPILRAYATLPISEAGGIEATTVDTVSRGGETLVVYGGAVFTEEHVVDARRSTAAANVTEFRLSQRGAEALRSFTIKPGTIGNRMALLFGSRWVGFPSVQAVIHNGHFIIIDLTEAELIQATEAFSSKE